MQEWMCQRVSGRNRLRHERDISFLGMPKSPPPGREWMRVKVSRPLQVRKFLPWQGLSWTFLPCGGIKRVRKKNSKAGIAQSMTERNKPPAVVLWSEEREKNWRPNEIPLKRLNLNSEEPWADLLHSRKSFQLHHNFRLTPWLTDALIEIINFLLPMESSFARGRSEI